MFFAVDDDGNLYATPATATIKVAPISDAPGAMDDTFSTDEDVRLTGNVNVLGNDTDIDGDTLVVNTTPVVDPDNGSVELNADGTFTYTPDLNFVGFDSFTYEVSDGNGGTSTATVTINVAPVNDAPTGADNTVTTLEDTDFTFAVTDFTFADAVDSNTLLAVIIDTIPANGQLLLDGTAVVAGEIVLAADIEAGYLTFQPDPDASGINYADFTFRVQDDGGVSNGGFDTDATTRTMNINVTSVNDVPSGTNNTVSTLEDTGYSFSIADFGFSDTSDGDSFRAVNIVTIPSNGQLLLDNTAVSAGQFISAADITDGKLVFQPDPDDHGSNYTSFSFRVQDDGGTANGGSDIDATARTISIDVTSVSDAPSGTNSTVTTLEDIDYEFTVADFGFSDSNDGDAFTAVTFDTLPNNGALLLNNAALNSGDSVSVSDIDSGNLVFRPTAQDNGANYASLEFRVQDSGNNANGGSNIDSLPRTLSIDVTPVNDAPFGTDGQIQTSEDTAYTLSRTDFGFIDNRDPGDQLSAVRIEVLPTAGQLQLNGLSISVGDIVTVSQLDAGQFLYIPGQDRFGSNDTSFDFRVIDDNNQPANAISEANNILSVSIDPVSDAPTGSDNTLIAVEDTSYVFTTDDFGFSDQSDGDALIAVLIDELPTAGTLTLNGVPVNTGEFVTVDEIISGSLQYLAAPNANGTAHDELGFRVVDGGTDGTANTDIEIRKITLDVLDVNDAPSAENNTIATAENTDYVFSLNDFGFSDVADGNALSFITVTSLPDIGTLLHQGVAVNPGDTISAASLDAGELIYQPTPNVNTPAPDASGSVQNSFSFTVTDNGGIARGGENTSSTEHLISIEQTQVNDPPVLVSNGATVAEGDTVVIDSTLLGATDPDDTEPDDLIFTVTTLPVNGQLLLNGEVVTAGTLLPLRR